MLADYEDAAVVEFLKYGFPIGFSGKLDKNLGPVKNHKGVTDYPNEFANTWKRRNLMVLSWALLTRSHSLRGFVLPIKHSQ